MIYNIKFQAIGFKWPVFDVELFEASVDPTTTLMEIILYWQEEIAFYKEIGFFLDKQCTRQITKLHTTFAELQFPDNVIIYCKENEQLKTGLILFENNIDIHVYLETKCIADIEAQENQTLQDIIKQLKQDRILQTDSQFTYVLTDYNSNIISSDLNYKFSLRHRLLNLEITPVKVKYNSKIGPQKNCLSQTITPDSKVGQLEMISVYLQATTFNWQQENKKKNTLRIKLNLDSTIEHFIEKLVNKGVLSQKYNICLSVEQGINKISPSSTFRKQNIQENWVLYLQE